MLYKSKLLGSLVLTLILTRTVLNEFDINYGVLGNWTSLTSNVQDKDTGKSVSAPYETTTVKVGVIGFTSERPAMAVGPSGFKGLEFTDGDKEFKKYVT